MLSKDQNPKGSSSIESAFAFICPLAIVVASCAAFPPPSTRLAPSVLLLFLPPEAHHGQYRLGRNSPHGQRHVTVPGILQ